MTFSSWQGWATPKPNAGWLDLTRTLDADVERVSTFPAPNVSLFKSMPVDPLNVTRLDTVVHVGTHLDAPVHFIPDGPSISEIPVERLVGPGVAWRLHPAPLGLVDMPMFVAARPAPRRGDMVLLDTGWGARWGDASYHTHPSLTIDAAQWLVDVGVTLVAFDFPTPDLALELRSEGFDWPVHQVLLRNGVLVVEHLAPAEELLSQRVEVIVGAAKIGQSADGAPARVLARREA